MINLLEWRLLLLWSAVLCLEFQSTSQNENPSTANSTDYYEALRQAIFGKGRINPSHRPVLNHTSAVDVNLYLVILQVLDLDERTGTLVVNGWGDFYWQDEQIHWDEEDYGGLNHIEVPDKTIWKPDLAIYNNAEASTVFRYGQSLIYVHNDGSIFWLPTFTSKTSCPMDHRNFPFDKHVCNIDIGSWSYSSNEINITHTPVVYSEDKSLQQFKVPNVHWEMTQLPVKKVAISLECCPDQTFPFIRYSLLLQRRSPLYKFSFLAPTIMSAIITVALMLLPPNSSNRFVVGGVAIIVQIILLMGLTFSIPPGGYTVPHIVLFCGNSFIMSCVSMVISIVMERLCKQHTYIPLPSKIKNALNGVVGKILCLNLNATREDVSALSGIKGDGSVETGPDLSNNHAAMDNKPSQFGDWILLASALNNICFIIYCLSFVVILLSSFA